MSSNPIHDDIPSASFEMQENGGSKIVKRTNKNVVTSVEQIYSKVEHGDRSVLQEVFDIGGGAASQFNKLRPRDREVADTQDIDYSLSHAWRQKHRKQLDMHIDEHHLHLMASFEGLDYDPIISDVKMGGVLREDGVGAMERIISRWFLTFLIGVSVGTIGFLINICVENLAPYRYSLAAKATMEGKLGTAYAWHLCISVPLALASALLVNYVEPAAAGSGIPEVKGYLNGSNYLRLVSLKTGFVKFVGIILSVSSGLAIGKEGPLIHIGSILGANYATLPGLHKLSWFKNSLWPLRFRNDRDKRDFVSSGAAAGVAAAFGSPTGGICFAIEEASSFWQLSLTWRTYFCTALSTSVIWLWTSAYMHTQSYDSDVKFGYPGSKYPMFQLWQLPWIGIQALFGGLFGALFCESNFRITQWRIKNVMGHKDRQIFQVFVVIFLTVTLCFFMPSIYDSCYNRTPNWICNGYQNKYYCGTIHPRNSQQINPSSGIIFVHDCKYQCKDYSFFNNNHKCQDIESSYSTMATLTNMPWDDVIHALFHNDAAMDLGTLFLYVIVVFFLANITYGITVPSGLFVPGILIGAGIGRMQGEIMRIWFPGGAVHPGIWAMIGAASMLSGVTRITITITVILYETTGEWSLILPIMATVIIAKSIADMFNISLYDMHVELKCIPFVEPAPPKAIEGLEVRDVMNDNIKVINQVPIIRDIISLLESCSHNGFPVINDDGKIRGIMLRNNLIILLKHYEESIGYSTKQHLLTRVPNVEEDWKTLLPLEAFATSLQSKVLKVVEVEHLAKKLPQDAAIDLRPYMNRFPIILHERTPIIRAFGIVRGIGCRHLPICNDKMEPVGMVTRKELMTDFKNTLV